MKRVFATIGFTIALTLVVLNLFPKYILIILLLSAALLLVSLLLKKFRQALVAPVVLSSVIFACLVFMCVNSAIVEPQKQLDTQTASTTFQIVDIPQRTIDGKFAYVVKTISIDKENAPQNIKLRVKSSYQINAECYDYVTANLTFYSIGDNAFDSLGYYSDNIYLSSTFDECSVVQNDDKPINYYFIIAREYIVNILQNNFDTDKSGVAIALLTGDKSNLSTDIYYSFKTTGTVHLLAVSGFHISLISVGIYWFLKRIGIPLLPRTVISVVILISYSAIADFSKSVIRASLMLGVIYVSRLINRKADTLNSLGFALFIICLNPFAVTSPSAQLSVCSIIGIAIIAQRFDDSVVYYNKVTRYIVSSFVVAFSCLIAVLPIIYITYKSFSIIGVLISFIIMPIAEFTIAFEVLFVVFSKVPIICVVLKSVLNFLLGLMIKITDLFSVSSIGNIDINNTWFGLALATIFLLMGISLFIFKKINPTVTVSVAVVLIIFSVFLNGMYTKDAVWVDVFSDGYMIVYDSDTVVCIGPDGESAYYNSNDFLQSRENIYMIDCYYTYYFYSDNVTSLLSDDDFYIEISDNSHLQCVGGVIYLTMCDNTFLIDENRISCGDYVLIRDISSKFGADDSYKICATKDERITIRRVDNG